MSNTASLVYTTQDGERHVYDLDGPTFRVGRLEENDLTLDNPYISRVHAEIAFDGARHTIRDFQSTSGTFVNDHQITERLLKDGDRIRFGRGHGVEFVFHSNLPAAAGGKELEDTLHPVRVFPPEASRFINTARLPASGDLPRATIDHLRALYEFTSEILTAQSPQELSDKLADFLRRTLKSERCAVLFYDDEKDTLDVSAARPSTCETAPSSSITRLAYDDNVAVFSIDARSDDRFASGDSIQLQSIRSVMCAPIGSKTRTWGVCYVDNLNSDHPFDEEELDFLMAVARQSGLAMENLYLMEEQRRSLESFIRTLAASLDARDDNTAGHSARVGAYSAAIARTMRLGPEEVRLIYYAGLLHDYGKIGIRDDVLLKPAELTPEEYEHVKEHPLHTFRLLSKIRLPADLADIPMVAAAHHERWDGSGYPHGLRGEEIPLGSRIVAVADAYDALTEERVYNRPCSPEKALDEITQRSASYFDPDVVAAFTEYFNSEIEPRHRRAVRNHSAE
ncbi:MAG TPA: HD domain-containing phosphohydrolase [Blastocatellia bacterium]|nr:HD domain-containing phosphohydrolase [Blastocatellia bacterium]